MASTYVVILSRWHVPRELVDRTSQKGKFSRFRDKTWVMGEGRGRPDKLSNCRPTAEVRVSGVTGMELNVLNNGAELEGARRRSPESAGKSHR